MSSGGLTINCIVVVVLVVVVVVVVAVAGVWLSDIRKFLSVEIYPIMVYLYFLVSLVFAASQQRSFRRPRRDARQSLIGF